MTALLAGEKLSYADLVLDLGVRTVRMGVWAQYGMPALAHGWKLHLSSVQKEVPRLLQTVIPIVKSYDVPFKVAAEPWILGLLNEGLLGDTQVGKFMTVYADVLPEDEKRILVAQLIEATRGFQGPVIASDAPLGGVVYCRYGEFRPTKRRNRLGIYEAAREDRDLVSYQVPFRIPDGVDGAEIFGVSDVEDDLSLGTLGPGFLPVGTVVNHAKGTVFLALDMRAQTEVKKVVLKEGRSGCMSDNQGRDVTDRLRHQAHVHDAIQGKVRAPGVESFFQDGNSVYLALELIEGFDLRAFAGIAFRQRDFASRIELLSALLATAKEVEALHECGYVHRDLSPANIHIEQGGRACLMDLELAHAIGDIATPFTQGTVGFISPQQQKNLAPATSDDVFSMGAIVASLLTGFPGHQLPIGATDLDCRLARLSGADVALCAIVAQCLADEPASRPSVQSLWRALEAALERAVAGEAPAAVKAADLNATVSKGVEWLLSGATRDRQSGVWLSPALEASHAARNAPVGDWRIYRSTNRGVSGVLYLLCKLWRHGLSTDQRIPDAVNQTVDWLLAHQETPDDQMPGLHFGEAGVALAIAEAIAANLVPKGRWTEPYFRQVFSSRPDWPDLTHGAAGQGIAALCCGQLLDETWIGEASDAYADHLRMSQEEDGCWILPSGVEEMEDKAFTGIAHGAAGIVHFLACHAMMRGDAASLEAAERGAQWLQDQGKPSRGGAGLSWTMEPGTSESWNWWCHGAPGIALAFLSLYRATGDELYAGTARACLRAIPADFRAPNLSQCHGLSGLGDILLEGYAVLGEPMFLDRAMELAGDLSDLARPTGDGVAWHVEGLYSLEPDLMTGAAGIIHFLARATTGQPGHFGMPLQLPAGALSGRA